MSRPPDGGQARRTVCWLRHLSMDFLENTHPPLSSRHGIRRSAAMTLSVDWSMARYREAPARLSTSFGVTRVPPCRPSCAASRPPLRACGSARRAVRAPSSPGRKVGLVEIDAVDPLSILVCYSARHADDNAVRWHLAHDDRARADAAAVADCEAADDLGAGADGDIVAERRVALLLLEAGAGEAHTLVERHVLADLRGLADHHTHPVIDEEPAAESCGRMDLDAREKAGEVRHPARARGPARAPQAVRDSMEGERVHARVAENHFPRRARRRVTFHHGLDVVAQPVEHHTPPLTRLVPRGAAPTRPARPRASRPPPPRPRACDRPEVRRARPRFPGP